MGHNSAQYLHTLIEALRLSFADTFKHCADASKVHVPIDKMLCKDYAAERRKLISKERYDLIYYLLFYNFLYVEYYKDVTL